MVATFETPTAVALTHRFVWYDLMSTDRDASLPFFQSLLGWTTTDMDMGEMGAYTMLFSAGVGLGGAVQLDPSHGLPSHFIGYIACEDVDDIAARAPGLGGSVGVPPMDIPDVGRFAVIADPMGAHFSILTSLPGAPATPESDPPVGGVIWNEISTEDAAKTGSFYSDLFDWTTQASAMPGAPDYQVLFHGDSMVGGMMKPEHPGTPSNWLFYFRVEDIDASATTITNSGGSTISPIMDVPTVGRMLVASDPVGVVFALLQPGA